MLATIIILLLPLVGMQFSDEVDWDLADFIIAAALLISAGLSYEFIAKKMNTTSKRVAVSIVIVILLILIWAELAVGIFGTPFAGS